MRLSLLIVFFTLVTVSGYAQTDPIIVFGKINQQELDMQYYPLDSLAEAVMIYEKQYIDYSNYNGLQMNATYHGRIKILKTSGLDRANIILPFYKMEQGNEYINDIEAYTYNYENGKLITTVFKPSSVVEEKVSETSYIKKIFLENVKVGSVIEYRYVRNTPLSVVSSPRDWYFQSNIPMQWSEFVISIPSMLVYRALFSGYLPLHINTVQPSKQSNTGYKEQLCRYVVKDAPAFKNEPFITSRKEYLAKVEFGLVSYALGTSGYFKQMAETWGDVGVYLTKHEDFGQRILKPKYLNEIVKQLATLTDTTQRINAAFNYITTNFAWDEHAALMAEHDLKTVFENKKGSAAEINLLLVALLKALGIETYPVILSTRDNGAFSEEFPLLNKFTDLGLLLMNKKRVDL